MTIANKKEIGALTSTTAHNISWRKDLIEMNMHSHLKLTNEIVISIAPICFCSVPYYSICAPNLNFQLNISMDFKRLTFHEIILVRKLMRHKLVEFRI